MEKYKRAIEAHAPDLTIESIETNEDGQNNTVLIVNDAWVFRFPRYEAGRAQLQLEVQILDALQPRTAIPVPNPTYHHLNAPIGEAFMGYEKLKGKAINIYTLEDAFDDVVCDKLASQLAIFLRVLHTTPLSDLEGELPEVEGRNYWMQLYRQIRQHLFDKMRPDAREVVADHFETHLNNSDNFKFTPTLIHGDFGTGNLLFDSDNIEFSGVIDFGSAAIGDPATDLAALYGFGGRGEDFFQRMKTFYPDLQAMMPRIQFYAGTLALQEALHGILNNDSDALEAGLKPYV